MIMMVYLQNFITTYAGTGASGSTGDGGLAINARFYGPSCLAVDSSNGNLYVFDNNRIKIVTKSTGIITIYAAGNEQLGGPTQVGNGDGGLATTLYTLESAGLAVDSSNGNLYLSDTISSRIRMVTQSTGIITTFAGAGVTGGICLTGGDGGPATSAYFCNPAGVIVDSLYVYIADTSNHKVRLVTKSTGIIIAYAGTGTAGSSGDGGLATLAQLNYPYGVAIDSLHVYIADRFNNKIRMVTKSTGIITTFAGSGYGASTGTGGSSGDGGPATLAQLYTPVGVILDNNGNVYIVDQDNNKIRMVSKSTGIITTFAGTGYEGGGGWGVGGSSGDGGPVTLAQLNTPTAIAVDNSNGNIYIADNGNRKIRVVQQICPGGSYMSGSTCVLCLAGTYNPLNGTTTASACLTCPGSSTSQNGASQCTSTNTPAPSVTPGSPTLAPVATLSPTYLPGSPTPPPTVGGAIVTVQCVQVLTIISDESQILFRLILDENSTFVLLHD